MWDALTAKIDAEFASAWVAENNSIRDQLPANGPTDRRLAYERAEDRDLPEAPARRHAD
jgi:hypothetical protein